MRVASIQLKVIEESKDKALEHASQMIHQCRGANLSSCQNSGISDL